MGNQSSHEKDLELIKELNPDDIFQLHKLLDANKKNICTLGNSETSSQNEEMVDQNESFRQIQQDIQQEENIPDYVQANNFKKQDQIQSKNFMEDVYQVQESKNFLEDIYKIQEQKYNEQEQNQDYIYNQYMQNQNFYSDISVDSSKQVNIDSQFKLDSQKIQFNSEYLINQDIESIKKREVQYPQKMIKIDTKNEQEPQVFKVIPNKSQRQEFKQENIRIQNTNINLDEQKEVKQIHDLKQNKPSSDKQIQIQQSSSNDAYGLKDNKQLDDLKMSYIKYQVPFPKDNQMVDSLGLSKNVKNILDDWEKQFTYKYVKSDPLKDEQLADQLLNQMEDMIINSKTNQRQSKAEKFVDNMQQEKKNDYELIQVKFIGDKQRNNHVQFKNSDDRLQDAILKDDFRRNKNSIHDQKLQSSGQKMKDDLQKLVQKGHYESSPRISVGSSKNASKKVNESPRSSVKKSATTTVSPQKQPEIVETEFEIQYKKKLNSFKSQFDEIQNIFKDLN